MSLNWAIMKKLILCLALWPLFFSLQLLQQINLHECRNNSYVINVMLMNYSDFPSSTENLKLAVNQALERVQNELQSTGKTWLSLSCPDFLSDFVPQLSIHLTFRKLLLTQAPCLSIHHPSEVIMISLCKDRTALQMCRTIFAFMVFGQTLPACFSEDVQVGLGMWELLNWIRQDQWSI